MTLNRARIRQKAAQDAHHEAAVGGVGPKPEKRAYAQEFKQRLVGHLNWSMQRTSELRYRTTWGWRDCLQVLFEDAMRTHKRMPGPGHSRVSSSGIPDQILTFADIENLTLLRLDAGMPPHNGNRMGPIGNAADIDRMFDVLLLLDFIRSRNWHKKRRLVLMRANGATVEQCSYFWQPNRKPFSRQYLSEIMITNYGEIATGMERTFRIYRTLRGFEAR